MLPAYTRGSVSRSRKPSSSLYAWERTSLSIIFELLDWSQATIAEVKLNKERVWGPVSRAQQLV